MQRERAFISLLFVASVFLGSSAEAGKACKFVCVQQRAPKPFVIRATMSSANELEDLVIRRVETKKGRISKMIWEESAGDVDLDLRFQATASQWKNALPFRVEDEGEVQEAILYVPTEMAEPDAPSVLRSRMKIKLKSGSNLDLRLQCART